MSGIDWIVMAVIALAVGLAARKLVRDKKQGKKCSGCSGCPVENSCSPVK